MISTKWKAFVVVAALAGATLMMGSDARACYGWRRGCCATVGWSACCVSPCCSWCSPCVSACGWGAYRGCGWRSWWSTYGCCSVPTCCSTYSYAYASPYSCCSSDMPVIMSNSGASSSGTPTPAPAPNSTAPGQPTPAPLPGEMGSPSTSMPSLGSPMGMTATASNSGLLTIWVPSNAKVYVNGLETKSTGTKRNYVSYGLKPGYSYKYEIKAQIVRDGQLVEDSRTVVLTAGDNETVAFGFNRDVNQALAANP